MPKGSQKYSPENTPPPMPVGAVLSERKKEILRVVVDAHISGGEPIGSKYLTESNLFDLSSATLRNEMAELTELGYLEQPHTSAGRVPSEAGYRFYVEQLMSAYALTTREIAELNRTIKQKTERLDRILQDASRVVAALTNYPSLAAGPVKSKNKTVGRIAVHYVDENKLLLIMLHADGSGQTKSKVVSTSSRVTADGAASLELLLNSYVAGREISTLAYTEIIALEKEAGVSLAPVASGLIKALFDFFPDERESVSVGGVEKLLSYPEFSNKDKLQAALRMLDNKEELLDIVRTNETSAPANALTERGVSILIGSENPADDSHTSSLVLKTIKVGDREVGTIGVVGPRRMDYAKVVTTMDYIADKIAEAMGAPDNPQGGG